MIDTPSKQTAVLAYQALGPDEILSAIESEGWPCDGRLFALNSYENRVYQVGLEDGGFIVAKFYRPERWSDAAIAEEHQLAGELADIEIPVVAPLANPASRTLLQRGPYRFALFPYRGGRPPNLEDPSHLEQLGRFLARAHRVGATRKFEARPELNVETFGIEARRFLLTHGWIPSDLVAAYESLTEYLLDKIAAKFDALAPVRRLRLHGDCHPGNILWTDEGPHIVDLDDARSGPAVQDLWMFLSGDRADQSSQLHHLLEGYSQFNEFDARELLLIEPLRTLRLMHYYAWLARRWSDPAFPRAFPWFGTQRAWEEHVLHLREQAALLNEEPLRWD